MWKSKSSPVSDSLHPRLRAGANLLQHPFLHLLPPFINISNCFVSNHELKRKVRF